MRAVALLTNTDTHLDHLGVLSHFLEIALITSDENIYTLAKQFYPFFNLTFIPAVELSLPFLAENFDVIFQTGKFWAYDLAHTLELFCNKKMRFVFCPHGNSDKGHSLQQLTPQDVCLVYGQHLLDILKKNGTLSRTKQIVRTGNYRYLHYQKYQGFYDDLALKKVFSRFAHLKPVILYAPTYTDGENTSSFFYATERIINELQDEYNVLIKLHPFLLQSHPAHVWALMGKYEASPSVLFLQEFPPIYPLLNKSSLYIGDYSSIGYDFLLFNKPLLFLSDNKRPSFISPLAKCGKTLTTDNLPHLKHTVRETLALDVFAPCRKATYQYAFGETREANELKKQIGEMLHSSQGGRTTT